MLTRSLNCAGQLSSCSCKYIYKAKLYFTLYSIAQISNKIVALNYLRGLSITMYNCPPYDAFCPSAP